MARVDAGSIDVAAAGTAEQLSAFGNIGDNAIVRPTDRIKRITFTPRSDNSGASSYIGTANVESTYGYRVLAGESLVIEVPEGGVPFKEFWVDSDTSGDTIDWIVIF